MTTVISERSRNTS